MRDYAKDKAARRETGAGAARAIPCVNHPVFKDRAVNVDPREEYVRKLMASRGELRAIIRRRDAMQKLIDALVKARGETYVFMKDGSGG